MQFGVSQLVRFMGIQSGQNRLVSLMVTTQQLVFEICMYARLNKKPVQDEDISRDEGGHA